MFAAAFFALTSGRHRPPLTFFLAVRLVMTLLSIAGPLALGPGAVRLARTAGDPLARRWMLCGLTAGALLLQFITVGWLDPLALRAHQDAHPQLMNGELVPVHSIGSMTLDGLARTILTALPESYGFLFLRNEAAKRVAWTMLPAAIVAFAWGLATRFSARGRLWLPALAWILPAPLLMAPSWLVFSFRIGGEYGLPAAFLQFLPVVLLFALTWPLRASRHLATDTAPDRQTEAQ